MQVLFKEDLFKRLHERRPRLEEEDFADIYRCMINFLIEDIKTNSTPFYKLPYLGFMYLPVVKAAHSQKTKTEIGLKRYEKLIKSYMYQDNRSIRSPLFKKSMLSNWTNFIKIEELEKIQNGIKKDI